MAIDDDRLYVLKMMIDFEKAMKEKGVDLDFNTGYVPRGDPYYIEPATRSIFAQWCLGR